MVNKKEEMLKTLVVGDLIAFKVHQNDAKNYSGIITKIAKDRDVVEVSTKNGKCYFVEMKNITWINRSGRWPRHIMLALRGIGEIEENNNLANENVEEVEVIDNDEAGESEV